MHACAYMYVFITCVFLCVCVPVCARVCVFACDVYGNSHCSVKSSLPPPFQKVLLALSSSSAAESQFHPSLSPGTQRPASHLCV